MHSLPFALTLFLSASLGMSVQPLAGKLLLPAAGGTPAVWSTCLMFFQIALLAGYLAADRLAGRRLVYLGLWLFALPLVLLVSQIAEPTWVAGNTEYPFLGLLGYLAVAFGPGYVLVSTTAPTLQRWFADSPGRNPYPLYAASNVGSLYGLISYPFLVEPNSTLAEQQTAFRFGIVVLFFLIVGCAMMAKPEPQVQAVVPRTPLPRRSRRLIFLLAALMSCWLTATTTHLTTDLAPVPLLWVVPLALYLLSFVVVFARWPEAARTLLGRVVPAALVFLVIALAVQATEPVELVVGLHLSVFFLAALLCHGEVAALKPPPAQLTDFYLMLSLGGVAGGTFAAVLAPVVFSRLGMIEYPACLVLAALVRPGLRSIGPTRRDTFLLIGFIFAAGLVRIAADKWLSLALVDTDALTARIIRSGLTVGLPATAAFVLVRGPVRFAGALAFVLILGASDRRIHGEVLEQSRNFFGRLRVTRSEDGDTIRLVHGTTQHGAERTADGDRPKPLMYYHERGPVGRLFRELPAERTRRVGVVGLGVGAMAYYAEPGSRWTFFEIDPAVVRIARDSGRFHFLPSCRGDWDVVVGDARRELVGQPDGSFDLLVLDAFSSDAVPVHLLTAEAFALYARKLSPDGVLVLHLSNRYLDLPPLAARLGQTCEPPFEMRLDDDAASETEAADGKFPSTWAVLARKPSDWGPALQRSIRFQKSHVTPGPVWTDDYSSLRGIWK